MTHDSGFWILLVQRPPRAESWAVVKAAVGSEQIPTSWMTILQALLTSAEKVSLDARSTQNHDVRLHFVTHLFRIRSKNSSCLSLDCDKQMEQNPKPPECENWECKSAHDSAITAEFLMAESCMILKLTMTVHCIPGKCWRPHDGPERLQSEPALALGPCDASARRRQSV